MFSKMSLLFLFLISTATADYLPPTTNVVQGGYGKNQPIPASIIPTSQIAKKVQLNFGNYSPNTDSYFWANAQGSSGQYKVPNGETVYCTSLSVADATLAVLTWGFTTASFTDNAAAPPATSACYSSSTACASFTGGDAYNTGGATTYENYPVFITFAANDYPMLYSHTTAANAVFASLDCLVLP